MEVRPLTDAQALTTVVARQPLQPFLQSWTWGEFQRGLGRPIWRLGVFDGNQLLGSALVIQHEIILGKSYLYCPRGPLADTPEALSRLFSALKELGREQGAMYVKVDPTLYHFQPDWSVLAPSYNIGTALQPQQTIILPTNESPETLLEKMHQKTRYNIRLAEKRGVTVRWSTGSEDVPVFLELMHKTAARQGIRLHSNSYYAKLFSVLQQAGMAEFAFGIFEEKTCVANMVIWHGQTATYLHGGSDDSVKDVMAPYAVQWATMQRAHERGVHDYDLWGVAPEDASDHKWAGVTRFKKGFGGKYVEFPTSFNTVLQPQWYQAYRLAKRIRGGVDPAPQ